MCEQARISITQVKINVLNFDDLLKEVLIRSLNMSLPATFKKIINANPADNTKQTSTRDNRERNGRGKKTRKN
jgi:hypothetical protein